MSTIAATPDAPALWQAAGATAAFVARGFPLWLNLFGGERA